MPLKQIQKLLKMDSQKSNRKDDKYDKSYRKNSNFVKKKDKFGRKRSQSFCGGVSSKFCPPYKCRKRPMLPTKFLLGGNICDPLNLNSLQDEEINRTVNAVTPKSSPIPTPPQRRGHIEVIIPPNIHDPLNLIGCADDAEYEQQLTSPLKKGGKRRKKKKRTSSATTEPSDADISSASEAKTPDVSVDSAKIPEIDSSLTTDASSPKEKPAKVTRDLKLELSPTKEKKRKSDSYKDNPKKMRRLDSMDKIVSPVVPQPGAWVKRPRNNQKTKDEANLKMPQFKERNRAYQYGNYNRYYGYRNPHHEVDPRLRCFATHRDIFIDKDILDIGCNVGHITLSVARDFGAKSVVGLDIDKKLIGIARKNIRHYVNCNDSPRADQECDQKEKHDKFFPISMPILYGPVDVPGMQNEDVKGKGFPHNVNFVQGNYVLDDDTLLTAEQPQFDVILCLSITKWLHLNWGDAGLKQVFKRMYAQLRPGGKLILEPQSWASYKHKKKLTETIYKNYHNIKFFPEKFTQYLLSSEVGFAKSEIMDHPHHSSKGFQRPIQIFTKSDLSPSQSQRSYSVTPSHTITSANFGRQVYTCLPSPDIPENISVVDDLAETTNEDSTSERILRLIARVDNVCDSTEDRGGTSELIGPEEFGNEDDLKLETAVSGELQLKNRDFGDGLISQSASLEDETSNAIVDPEESKVYPKCVGSSVEDPKSSIISVGNSKEVVNSVRQPKEVVNSVRESKEVVNSVEDPKEAVSSLEVLSSARDSKETVSSLGAPKNVTSVRVTEEIINSLEDPKEAVTSLGAPKNVEDSNVLISVRGPKKVVSSLGAPKNVTSVRDLKEVVNSVEDPKEAVSSLGAPKRVNSMDDSKETLVFVRSPKEAVGFLGAPKNVEVLISLRNPKETAEETKKSTVFGGNPQEAAISTEAPEESSALVGSSKDDCLGASKDVAFFPALKTTGILKRVPNSKDLSKDNEASKKSVTPEGSSFSEETLSTSRGTVVAKFDEAESSTGLKTVDKFPLPNENQKKALREVIPKAGAKRKNKTRKEEESLSSTESDSTVTSTTSTIDSSAKIADKNHKVKLCARTKRKSSGPNNVSACAKKCKLSDETEKERRNNCTSTTADENSIQKALGETENFKIDSRKSEELLERSENIQVNKVERCETENKSKEEKKLEVEANENALDNT